MPTSAADRGDGTTLHWEVSHAAVCSLCHGSLTLGQTL